MNKASLWYRSFPRTRMRRTRAHDWSRRLVREHALVPDNFIWPLFVREGDGAPEPIKALPGVSRFSITGLVEQAKHARNLGIPAIAIFPCVNADDKDDDGTNATNPDNLICNAIRAVHDAVPDIGIAADVALDPFTSHGHDGVIRNGVVDNDKTVEILANQAIVQARAGASIIAPSDMMDGRIKAIRDALDGENFDNVIVMSYGAKYASAFYGPFRQAVGAGNTSSAGNISNASNTGGISGKDTYQMDSANSDEALHEIALDISEGADIVMVKPGLPYLDVIQRVASNFGVPVAAYQVSGEYAMIEAAAAAGSIDRNKAIYESLIAFRRAGATIILTYYAAEIAAQLKNQ